MDQSDFYVLGGLLTIGVLTFESTGDYVDAHSGGTLNIGSMSGGLNAHINANSGSLVDMLSTTDTGTEYYNTAGEIVLSATPNPDSSSRIRSDTGQ